jgi:tRNA(Ile)-lysidine synthase TilS/MesJ
MGDNENQETTREIELRAKLEELGKEVAEDEARLAKDRAERDRIREELKEAEHKYHIIVNLREKTVDDGHLSFEQVVKIAYPDPTPGKEYDYTVTYDKGPKENPEGEMVAGDTVKIKNGMVFNVTQTDRS